MLGYVIPDKGELKVREYEIYTGYYCGVCKYIGREYGQLPRMVLSYDAAFIALLLASVDPAPDEPVQEHCAAHHVKYKTIIRNRAIEYSGDLMLILAWFKLLDDAQDEGKVSAKAALAAFRHTWNKLQKKHPSLCEHIDAHLASLNELERAQCPSIDRVSEDFARVMDDIFRDGVTWLYGPETGADDSGSGETFSGSNRPEPGTDAPVDEDPGASVNSPRLHETFANLGYHLGKWIYLIDAVDDIEENLESGAYNPLLYRFGYRASEETAGETPDEFRQRIDEQLRFNLFQYLAVISESLEFLDIKKNSGIIENVVYFGLNRRTEEVLRRIQPEKNRHFKL